MTVQTLERLYAGIAAWWDARAPAPAQGAETVKVYPEAIPQGATRPLIVTSVLDGPETYHLRGRAPATHPLVQLMAVGPTVLEASRLADRLKLLLSGYSGPMGDLRCTGAFVRAGPRAVATDPQDGGQQRVHAFTIDVELWFDEED